MREIEGFMDRTDELCRCYGISVKGKAFPSSTLKSVTEQRCTFLRISSYAFANCLKIEKELGKHKKRLYVDTRIIRHIANAERGTMKTITMYPNYHRRVVHMYRQSLWKE
jgi:hypothetical protein